MLLVKSLEFTNAVGQKVKIVEIPVLEEDNPNQFMIRFRLQKFMSGLNEEQRPKSSYSFREYLKSNLRWPDYEQLYNSTKLKNNA
ncbi:hypothetical protein A8F94_02895 [Bacillus sp. FJAT-27225]|nr:hypothetical protein A8F94_02895 [Bacillus sp. FJAT-27225]